MHPEPNPRHERFIAYTEALQERFAEGVLSELQDLPQWVVWRAELEDGRPKKIPYNPTLRHLQARASVKIPKRWGTLADALAHTGKRSLFRVRLYDNPALVMIDLDHSI